LTASSTIGSLSVPSETESEQIPIINLPSTRLPGAVPLSASSFG
jgi:hypothetical protein